MSNKWLNRGRAGPDKPTMEQRTAARRLRPTAIGACVGLLFVVAGHAPVSGTELVPEFAVAHADDSPANQRAKPEHDRAARQVDRLRALRGPADRYNPAPGQPVFKLHIPAIDLKEVVVQGVEAAQLARGPGHYPSCGVYFAPPYCSDFEQVWPGERGRSVIGAHRTLAGAEFFDLGELRAGDAIRVHGSWGDFVYRVTQTRIVDDADRSIIVPGVAARELVLVTCHPKFSSAQRLLVYSRLERATGPHRRGARDPLAL